MDENQKPAPEFLGKVDAADIRFDKGLLLVDLTGVSPYGKHYFVTLWKDGDALVVKGHRPSFGFSLSEGAYDVNEITEDSIIERKRFLWSKKPRRISGNIVEFLPSVRPWERRTYQATNYRIIEDDQFYLDSKNFKL